VDQRNLQEPQPFAVAWRTIDGLNIRYAMSGSGGDSIVLLSPWPESIFAFARVWNVGLARDAALLRERLPHARLDVLEAGHCVWEERAPEFESIVAQWVSGAFRQ
jgi:pimeloyl-ACP methyl ester carboxylesterase